MTNNYAADALFKRRLEDNIHLLEKLQLKELYAAVRPAYASMLTSLLKDCGINPLDHMTVIPSRYCVGEIIGKLIVPDHITYIGAEAFKWCSINHVEFAPNSRCTTVEDAFTGATIADKNIKFPESCNWVGAHCFENCEMNAVVLNCPTMLQFPEVFQDNQYPHYFVHRDSVTHDLLKETVPATKILFI